MLSLGTAKACNPRKFSLWQSYFSPICKNFLPRKFSAIRYAILTKCITRYCHIWKYNYLFTRKWKYSCPVQLKGNMSYMCVDYVEYRKRMLFYKLYSHIWKYISLFTRKWKYSCSVQLKGDIHVVLYTCGDYVEYRKCILFYKLDR